MTDLGTSLYNRLSQTLDSTLTSKVTGMFLEGFTESALQDLLAGPQSGLDEMVGKALDSIDSAALQASSQHARPE
jgi:hypothetical protein